MVGKQVIKSQVNGSGMPPILSVLVVEPNRLIVAQSDALLVMG
jgi:hypothetical protein